MFLLPHFICMSLDLSDEETEAMFLVDFTQKIINKKKETRDQMEREEEERIMATPIPAPQNPDEEWYDQNHYYCIRYPNRPHSDNKHIFIVLTCKHQLYFYDVLI